MNCKFKETISYGSQTFIKGETYSLSDKDALALGFKKVSSKTKEPVQAAESNDEAIETEEINSGK